MIGEETGDLSVFKTFWRPKSNTKCTADLRQSLLCAPRPLWFATCHVPFLRTNAKWSHPADATFWRRLTVAASPCACGCSARRKRRKSFKLSTPWVDIPLIDSKKDFFFFFYNLRVFGFTRNSRSSMWGDNVIEFRPILALGCTTHLGVGGGRNAFGCTRESRVWGTIGYLNKMGGVVLGY